MTLAHTHRYGEVYAAIIWGAGFLVAYGMLLYHCRKEKWWRWMDYLACAIWTFIFWWGMMPAFLLDIIREIKLTRACRRFQRARPAPPCT